MTFDLNALPSRCLPFEDSTFDVLLLSHVLEYLERPLDVMQELWRVATPNALLIIRVPHGGSDDAWIDVSHSRPFFPRTFSFFGQPNYHNTGCEYNGYLRCDSIFLATPLAAKSAFDKNKILSAIHYQRNLCTEMVALLHAVKPIRPRKVELTTSPDFALLDAIPSDPFFFFKKKFYEDRPNIKSSESEAFLVSRTPAKDCNLDRSTVVWVDGVSSSFNPESFEMRPSSVWEFRDGRVVASGFYVYTRNKTLIAGGYSYSRNWHQSGNRVLKADSSVRIPPVATVSGGVIIGGVASHFGHAFLDLIDRLISLDRVDLTRYKYLALHGPFDSSSIDLLHKVVPWVVNHEVLDVSRSSFNADRILLPENLSEKPYWASATVEAIQATAKKSFRHYVSERKVLYISRRKASQRRLLNDNYLLDRLQRAGLFVDVLIPEEASLEMQIESFRSARFVIGVIRSALFNIAFTRSSLRKIICLVDKAYLSMKGDNVQILRSLGTLVDTEVIFVACSPSSKGYDSDLAVGEEAINSLFRYT